MRISPGRAANVFKNLCAFQVMGVILTPIGNLFLTCRGSGPNWILGLKNIEKATHQTNTDSHPFSRWFLCLDKRLRIDFLGCSGKAFVQHPG